MALCAVCQAPCRGKCAKCGARLCALHKPSSARAKCVICKRLGTGVVRMVQAIPPYPASPPIVVSATRPNHAAALSTLTLAEQLAWIEQRRTLLHKKQARERAYLDRRATSGAHTPTDDAYEADSILESELLEALDLLETLLQGNASLPASGGTYIDDTLMLFPDPGLNDKIQP